MLVGRAVNKFPTSSWSVPHGSMIVSGKRFQVNDVHNPAPTLCIPHEESVNSRSPCLTQDGFVRVTP
ncbi:uncharacterized protein PHALS_11484 [Plasmopara halstedii]|uniref:Uncharacterized protein n=1 Tax=Plasmopara halstedii TaxID=4781 RepID=A0A0P1A507_PLAHL|nr:uncharacterized protein PHALS_11484 [Plasmopara halstedii]CEG35613.1 hypothetical protein PHALS_11484 [Plasmopara halstedii]|eukprot:XP_024571982.1 hypothetical protein PHALS_11484 [Plasmopara halstedii]